MGYNDGVVELSREKIEEFRGVVWGYYREFGRELPWRMPALELRNGVLDPYAILISEVMLQQTQVARVIPKYEAFLIQFPTLRDLAEAELGDVLRAWNGLGYNRRAKYLWEAARIVQKDFSGKIPDDAKSLESLPGIGRNTAAAIRAYAFNERAVFTETNIRTIYIHHFFMGRSGVADSELLPLIEQTLPEGNSALNDEKLIGVYRDWYWALMDYGTSLKAIVGNVSRSSRHYVRQSAFKGSKRQLRGRVLRLLSSGSQTFAQLQDVCDDERLQPVLDELCNEGMVHERGAQYML